MTKETQGRLKTHTIEFRHNGALAHLDVPAYDFDDAMNRVRSAHYNGEPLIRVFSVGV